MTCSYSVGVLLAIAKHYGFTQPDIAIGGSGNAASVAYYVAGQWNDTAYIWSNLIGSKKMINFWRFWKVIDIDYLIDDVLRTQSPIHLSAFYNSPTTCLIPATNIHSGELTYFSNKNNDDVYEALRASKAMPIAFGKRIRIHDKDFVDTYASSDTTLHVKTALEMGATKIIVIDNTRDNAFHDTMFKLWSSLRGAEFKHTYQQHVEDMRSFNVPDDKDVLVITPQEPLHIESLNNDSVKLRRTINQGFQEALEHTELKKFIEDIKKPIE